MNDEQILQELVRLTNFILSHDKRLDDLEQMTKALQQGLAEPATPWNVPQ